MLDYLMLPLDVVSKQGSFSEALSTLVTGMVASCNTHPPRNKITLREKDENMGGLYIYPLIVFSWMPKVFLAARIPTSLTFSNTSSLNEFGKRWAFSNFEPLCLLLSWSLKFLLELKSFPQT